MEDRFGLIELVLSFGLLLGLLTWQLISVRRELRRDREAEKPPPLPAMTVSDEARHPPA